MIHASPTWHSPKNAKTVWHVERQVDLFSSKCTGASIVVNYHQHQESHAIPVVDEHTNDLPRAIYAEPLGSCCPGHVLSRTEKCERLGSSEKLTDDCPAALMCTSLSTNRPGRSIVINAPWVNTNSGID